MKKQKFLIYPLLIMGMFLVFASSCEKDDDDNNNSNNNTTNTFTDSRDGNVYQTVTIGDQVWMAENLKYLPSVVGQVAGSETNPYYYVYGFDGTDVNDAKATSYYTAYGVLYNWPAAMAGFASSTANPSGVQGVCPNGWHLPSEAEWTELTDYLGGDSVAAGKMKEAGTSHWNSPNTGADNSSGFTALPDGYRGYNGGWNGMGRYAGFWSATNATGSNAWYRRLDYNDASMHWNDRGKSSAVSVRCVKDN